MPHDVLLLDRVPLDELSHGADALLLEGGELWATELLQDPAPLRPVGVLVVQRLHDVVGYLVLGQVGHAALEGLEDGGALLLGAVLEQLGDEEVAVGGLGHGHQVVLDLGEELVPDPLPAHGHQAFQRADRVVREQQLGQLALDLLVQRLRQPGPLLRVCVLPPQRLPHLLCLHAQLEDVLALGLLLPLLATLFLLLPILLLVHGALWSSGLLGRLLYSSALSACLLRLALPLVGLLGLDLGLVPGLLLALALVLLLHLLLCGLLGRPR